MGDAIVEDKQNENVCIKIQTDRVLVMPQRISVPLKSKSQNASLYVMTVVVRYQSRVSVETLFTSLFEESSPGSPVGK